MHSIGGKKKKENWAVGCKTAMYMVSPHYDGGTLFIISLLIFNAVMHKCFYYLSLKAIQGISCVDQYPSI